MRYKNRAYDNFVLAWNKGTEATRALMLNDINIKVNDYIKDNVINKNFLDIEFYFRCMLTDIMLNETEDIKDHEGPQHF